MGFAAFRIDVEGESNQHNNEHYVELGLTHEEIQKAIAIQLTFESIFFLDMILNFFKEYSTKNS
jgi:hypothetical protein